MDADQEARMLLAPLKDQPAPRSTLDAGGLRTAGRRRVRARRWAGAGAVAATTAIALVSASLVLANRPGTDTPPLAAETPATTPIASASPAEAEAKPPAFPVSCTARLLPLPAGAVGSFVESGDPSGRYLVGGYLDAQGNRRPLLWDRGALVPLDAPGQDNQTLAVNEAGVVAGSSITVVEGKLDFYNWVYRDGRVDLLTEVEHGPAEHRGVIDINLRGDILLDNRIRFQSPDIAPPPPGPAVWSDGRLRELEMPAGLKDVSAYEIDDDGTVIGRHLLEQGWTGERGLMWTPAGRVEEFVPPKGFGPAGGLRHIRNGWVVGAFKAPGKPDHEPAELLGNLGSGSGSGGFQPAGVTLASAVNRHGWVAGFHREAQLRSIPAIAGAGKLLKLPMPGGGTVGPEIRAASISDDGRTVGGEVSAGGENHAATIWTCRP